LNSDPIEETLLRRMKSRNRRGRASLLTRQAAGREP